MAAMGRDCPRYVEGELRAMAVEGFTVYEAEWWHFDFKGWQQYGIQNLRFEEIGR